MMMGDGFKKKDLNMFFYLPMYLEIHIFVADVPIGLELYFGAVRNVSF